MLGFIERSVGAVIMICIIQHTKLMMINHLQIYKTSPAKPAAPRPRHCKSRDNMVDREYPCVGRHIVQLQVAFNVNLGVE